MPPWAGPVVYIHGAGEQENPFLLKRRLDGVLFGDTLGSRSRLAYYADQLHAVAPMPAGLEGRPDPIALAARPDTGRSELVRALAGSAPGGLEAGDGGRAALAAAFIARADAIEPPPEPAPGLEGRRFWDTGFRILVSLVARDVIQYLFDGDAEAMRAPLVEALASLSEPTLLIAHSLGTIITYDVLTAPGYAGPRQIRLVTLGCPLGIENVQDRLRDGRGRPHPVPVPVERWTNLADPHDPVASGQPLAGEYDPHGFIVDDLTISNDTPIHHDLVEYLRAPAVRAAAGVA